ncbi:MAG TPA: transglutaminase domain-containing protein, partial [Thermomicrobiales bacterium]|nr:transglutaminase domain-containing protein [Thermomicrobiales bacterium]
MVSATASPPQATSEPSWFDRLTPAEGWITVVLHMLLILVAAEAVQREAWANGLGVLTPVAALAMLDGLILAKSRTPDLLSHALSFFLGLALAVFLTAASLDQSAGWKARLIFLRDRADLWYQRVEAGKRVDDSELFVLMMTFTVWLIAYCSAWMLYRRRWLLASVALPGMVILINLGYAPSSSTWPLVIYLLGALVLAARHYAFRRQLEWSRARLPSPQQLPWRFVRAGLTVAVVVVLLGWSMPPDAAQPLVQRLSDRLDQPLNAIDKRWQNWASIFGGGASKGGSFSSFGESFRLGGELNLSDDPVALVHADQPVYLAVHRYNWYDGHGWTTDVEDTFRAQDKSGDIRAPLITFQADDGVFLSSEMTGDRTRQNATITVLRQPGDLLFTIDTYLATNQVASVQVSWRQLRNEPFDVQHTDLSEQPEDLRELINLLRQATFTSDGGASSRLTIADPLLAARINATQTSLSQRFLNSRWSVGPDMRVDTLYVTGQLPVYDDVEAVRAEKAPAKNQSYQVTGLMSFASATELSEATGDDPQYIRDRYLQLPTTVTERTKELTNQIIADAGNRYDAALAIQNYLRDQYTYDEKVKVPPADQDVVDYFLFESKRGYCEYFASSMVVMLRSAGIPARVVAGFREVPYDQAAGGYLYREKQAHTWVEVFFPGYGWIPFEPTPGVAQPFERGDQAPTPEPVPTQTPEIAPTPTPLGPETAATATPVAAGAEQDPSQGGGGVGSLTGGMYTRVAAILAGAGLLFIGMVCLVWLWGFRGMSPIGALYARVQRIGRWWGVTPDPALTPVEYARELGKAAPAMRSPARALAQLYETEQYGNRPVSEQEQFAGRSAWKELRTSVMRSWRRRRAARRDGD